MKGLTYKSSGVDIKKADAFKKNIKSLVRASFRSEVLKDIGGFGSFFTLDKNKYRNPVLVSSSDGVGTKLKIASLCNKHDTVGIDAVAMNVNDILCTGAEPLFFLDYIAHSSLDSNTLLDIVRGINAGCITSGCSLIGGETAQMPGMYGKGEYDIAGFCVGVVERNNIIDGSRIKPGDVLIGLESNGAHSNGYSLVRKALSDKKIKLYCAELLKPTRIYVKPVLSLLRVTGYPSTTLGSGGLGVTGIAHITGGAFYDKIARILPVAVNVRIDKSSWPVPRIFRIIQDEGSISDKEMYHTFNMGVGLVLVVRKDSAAKMIKYLMRFKLKGWIIGEAVKGRGLVEIS